MIDHMDGDFVEISEWDFAELPSSDRSEALHLPLELNWQSVRVPTSVQAILEARGEAWSGLDSRAFVFRCRFDSSGLAEARGIRFNGLATLCEVWMNGEKLIVTCNMFREFEIDFPTKVEKEKGNEVILFFPPLEGILSKKQARPRYKTRLVEDQNLRWIRTSLLGRMPGWAPGGGVVGPYRSVLLIKRGEAKLQDFKLTTEVRDTPEGSVGFVMIETHAFCDVSPRLTLILDSDPDGELHRQELEVVAADDGGYRIAQKVKVGVVRQWWPHTHGEPVVYRYRLQIEADGCTFTQSRGTCAFRRIEFEASASRPKLVLNGEFLFCRGACWTPPDLRSLSSSKETYRELLSTAKAAGMNLLRVGGTMLYEEDVFYELCDELGILVWQDFMFANMDYPFNDRDFLSEVEKEIVSFLRRVSSRACLVFFCGGSEVAQQASMLGLPASDWLHSFYKITLPRLLQSIFPNVAYVENSPWGGDFPFSTNSGIAHYYGVGAYLRPIEDIRLSTPAFVTEGLAFSNVPSDRSLSAMFSDHERVPHHPKYKSGVPRDSGAGWDFADVTDHYLEKLFSIDPVQLRYEDLDRYFELARLASSEVISQALTELRRNRANCGGVLVWLFKDVLPGSGWGLLDCFGEPKAAYYFFRRACAAVQLGLVNERLNGFQAVLTNETDAPLFGELIVSCLRDGKNLVAEGALRVEVAARGQTELNVETVIGRFIDATHSYRFGPAGVTIVVAELLAEGRPELEPLRAFAFPVDLACLESDDLGLIATATALADGFYRISISAQSFAYGVCVSAKGFRAEENYFHLVPGKAHGVVLRPLREQSRLSGFVKAANCSKSARITIEK